MAVKLFLDAQGKAKFLALILNEISVQLSDSVHRNINEKCVIFLKTLIFDERFGRYRLNVPFCDDILDAAFTRICPDLGFYFSKETIKSK